MTQPKYKFFKQTQQIEQTLKSSYDPIKEWHPDPKGYCLIRINRKNISHHHQKQPHHQTRTRQLFRQRIIQSRTRLKI